MQLLINLYRNGRSKIAPLSSLSIRHISKHTSRRNIVKSQSREINPNINKITPFGWFLLVIPISTFGLGTWQVQRKKWKEDLIAKLNSKTKEDPVPLPDSLSELEKLEYRPVYVKGKFLHDKEIYVGPRSCIIDGHSASGEGSLFSGSHNLQGYNVITPFKLSDRDEIILVNRGWVPFKYKDPNTRKEGQIEDEVDLIGIVRLHENRPTFVPNNKPDSNCWFYRNLEQMCKKTGASPIFLDATSECNVRGGPVGGQTRISLRNEHLSYILTWYTLCAFTGFLWYKRIWKGLPPSDRVIWKGL